MSATKVRINEFLDVYTDEQNEFLLSLIEMFSGNGIGKGQIMKLAYPPGTSGQVDSALPQEAVNQIQIMMPSFNPYSYVTDYTEKSFGEIVNLHEKLVVKIHSKLQI